MTKKKLPDTAAWRKVTLKSFFRDKANAKKAQAVATRRSIDADDIAKWRVLRKIGAYNGTAPPSVKNLTPARRKALRGAFDQVQSFGAFRDGRTRRPFDSQPVTQTRTLRDHDGRVIKQIVSVKPKYVLDDYFAFARAKKPPVLSGTLRTAKGLVVPKAHVGSRVFIRSGKLIEHDYVGNSKFKITREGVSGAGELLELSRRIRDGKLKLKHNEGLRLITNGSMRRAQGFLYDDLISLAALIDRYAQEFGPSRFDEWADHAEIIMFTAKGR